VVVVVDRRGLHGGGWSVCGCAVVWKGVMVLVVSYVVYGLVGFVGLVSGSVVVELIFRKR